MKICVDCVLNNEDTDKCLVGSAPEDDGTCANFDPGEDNKVSKQLKPQKTTMDYDLIKTMYNNGDDMQDIANAINRGLSAAYYQVDKLIKSGELKRRPEKHKTMQPVKQVSAKKANSSIINNTEPAVKICPHCGQDVHHSKDYYEFKRAYESLPDEKKQEVYLYLQFLQFKQKGRK